MFPKLTGTQVAQWQGEWVKLAARPETPDPSPDPARPPDWPALIATRRWLAETSGTTFGGMPIDTDDRSKLLINGAALRADRSADYVLRWKTSQGFVDLTAAQVLAVADGSITAEMLEEGWPASA